MTVIIDEFDVDDEGRGVGPELGCVECHSEERTRLALGPIPYTVALVTGCCGDVLNYWRI